MNAVYAIILGIVEGLTEFLPVSSTGHLVLAEWVLKLDSDQAPWSVLLWVSQFGAILAVIVYFWRDLWNRIFHPQAAAQAAVAGGSTATADLDEGGDELSAVGAVSRSHKASSAPATTHAGQRTASMPAWQQHILTKLFVAMVPTALIGVLLKKYFDPLENMPLAVAGALIIGAGIMEFIDRRYRREKPQQLEDVTLRQAFLIGLFQCVSIWPGVSRAGASIMSGMALGLTPRVATEFSFYLAIPTMLGAAAKTLIKHRHELNAANASVVLIGSTMAFVVALFVVAAFIGYVKRYRFTPFAVYRVVLGVAVIAGWLLMK